MFHQRVLNAYSVLIDIDRAVRLMDKRLWLEACTEAAFNPHMPDEMDQACHLEHFGKPHPLPARPDAQEAWSNYCQLHKAKYGSPFPPNIRKTPF